MIVTSKELARRELIGLKCRVISATNPFLRGLEGTVVDETKNMIVLDDGRKEKRIPKKDAKFQFEVLEKKIEVDGKMISGRPEDRIRRRFDGYRH